MNLDINEIIIRYLDGSITDDERMSLFRWLKQSESNRTYFHEIRDLWLACNARYGADMDTEIALSRFRERVKLLMPPSQRDSFWKRKVPIYYIIGAAASILLLIGYFFKDSAVDNRQVINNLYAAEGSKGRFVLPDSSIVWLNGGSSLQYANDLSNARREVTLKGEAYFEVTKKEHIPFVVEVGAIKVKVLGTRFSINSYSKKDEIQVALLQGAVELIAGKSAPVILAPGNLACYNTTTGQTVITPDATGNVLYWVDNKLVFNREAFEQIAQVLERNFNIQVKIHDEKIKMQRFSGDFVKNESAEQIFAIMSADGNFRYKMKGSVVEVY